MSAYGYTFGRVPDGLLFSHASDRACRLYAILTRFADQHLKGDPPTRPQLAAYLDCSVDSLDRAVKELVAGGWLEVLPRSSKHSEKVRDANDYRLLSGPDEKGVAARVRPGGSRTGAATRTSGNDETAGNGSRTGAARGSRTRAATYKEVVKTDSESRKTTNGAAAPDAQPDNPSLFQAQGLPDPSPDSDGSPSPHGAAPPPPTDSQNGHEGKKTDTAKIVREVFEAWQRATDHPGAKLTDARRSKTTARLREGYTPEQLVSVVTDGWRADPWPGRVDNNDLVILLRDGPQVEKFLNLARKAKATSGNGHHADPDEALRQAREFNARQAARSAAANTTDLGRRLAAEAAEAKGADQ